MSDQPSENQHVQHLRALRAFLVETRRAAADAFMREGDNRMSRARAAETIRDLQDRIEAIDRAIQDEMEQERAAPD